MGGSPLEDGQNQIAYMYVKLIIFLLNYCVLREEEGWLDFLKSVRMIQPRISKYTIRP